MKLFSERECACGDHRNVAEHRLEEIRPFHNGLEKKPGIELDTSYPFDLEGDIQYLGALRKVLTNMESFDDIFGGGFRRRYRSLVVNVCPGIHSKEAFYSRDTDELVFACEKKGVLEVLPPETYL